MFPAMMLGTVTITLVAQCLQYYLRYGPKPDLATSSGSPAGAGRIALKSLKPHLPWHINRHDAGSRSRMIRSYRAPRSELPQGREGHARSAAGLADDSMYRDSELRA